MVDDEIPELTEGEKARLRAIGIAIEGMASAWADGTLDVEGVEATSNQIRGIDVDMPRVLASLHVPEDAEGFADALTRLLRRIPSAWGRWVSLGRGWYPLVTQLDEQLAELDVPGHHVGGRRLIGGRPASALWRRSVL